MNNSCPICGGQVQIVPSHRFGAGYYDCIEAGRRGCDRFFREDELVDPLEWSISETWARGLLNMAGAVAGAGFPAGRQN